MSLNLRTLSLAVALLSGLPILSPVRSLEAQTQVQTLHVETRPGARMTTLTLVFPEGARTDPADQSGVTFLLGRTLEAQAEAALLPLGGSLTIRVEKQDSRVTLTIPTHQWTVAWSRLRGLLASDSLSGALLERERARRLEELLFQQGAPVHTFLAQWHRHALAWALPVEQDPARPAGGSLEDIRRLTLPALEARRRQVFRLDAAQALLIAPPDAPAIRAIEESVQDPIRPAPSAAGGWEAERLVVNRDLTSSWIGVAWPIPDEVHWVTARFLAHRLHEMLNPTLPEPGIYRTEVTLMRAGAATLLTVVATVDPGVTLRRERQILDAMALLAAEPLQGLTLDFSQRRWKSALALRRMEPSAEADEGGILPDPEALSALLSGTRLRDLAAGLPAARILIYGPVPMMAAGPALLTLGPVLDP